MRKTKEKERLINSAKVTGIPSATAPNGRSAPQVLVLLSWYSADIHHGISRYAEKSGWNLDLSHVYDAMPSPQWNGDGIVYTAGVDNSLDRRVLRYRKPIVNIGTLHEFPAPRVAADMEKVVQLTIEYFTQHGFQHLAYYVRLGNKAELDKLRMFESGAAAARLTFHVLDCSNSPDRERLRQLGQQISQLPKPLAVTAQRDEFAVDIILAARIAQLRVPQDVAVLGCGDDPGICLSAPIPMSSINNNLEVVGYRAAALLDGLMHGESPPTNAILIPPLRVSTRKSTDILAVTEEDVLAAISIIKKRYMEPLTAKSVAAEIHVSERKLFDLFQHHLGHSVKEEILRQRIECAEHLLTQTRKKIQNVAWDSGFNTLSQMVKVFRRVKGTTPGAFRREVRRTENQR
ncbi:MAG: substrate-binding domain-containing protein [Phycisphaerae bacterium]